MRKIVDISEKDDFYDIKDELIGKVIIEGELKKWEDDWEYGTVTLENEKIYTFYEVKTEPIKSKIKINRCEKYYDDKGNFAYAYVSFFYIESNKFHLKIDRNKEIKLYSVEGTIPLNELPSLLQEAKEIIMKEVKC